MRMTNKRVVEYGAAKRTNRSALYLKVNIGPRFRKTADSLIARLVYNGRAK